MSFLILLKIDGSPIKNSIVFKLEKAAAESNNKVNLSNVESEEPSLYKSKYAYKSVNKSVLIINEIKIKKEEKMINGR